LDFVPAAVGLPGGTEGLPVRLVGGVTTGEVGVALAALACGDVPVTKLVQ
jgi:hypothetical protein